MNISKPTLLVNKAIALNNIKEMKRKADENKVILRPHFKTHQSAIVGNWFKNEGVHQITVSSVEMAYYFAKNGWDDITIAFPLNVREINDIIALNEKVVLSVLISSEKQLEALLLAKKSPVNFFIKIDVGYHRSGIEAKETEQIQKIIDKADKKLNFMGFISHFGNTYQARAREEVLKIFEFGINELINLKEKLGLKKESIISIGDTPSCSLVKNFKGIDEIRPGNFIYYDLMQKQIGACFHNQIAAAVACPVIDIYPKRHEILIYGGAVHLSKEYITTTENEKCFGEVVRFDEEKEIWGDAISKTYVKSLSQEHGIIQASGEFISEVKIGDLIGIIPVHSCLTANLLREITVVNN